MPKFKQDSQLYIYVHQIEETTKRENIYIQNKLIITNFLYQTNHSISLLNNIHVPNKSIHKIHNKKRRNFVQ